MQIEKLHEQAALALAELEGERAHTARKLKTIDDEIRRIRRFVGAKPTKPVSAHKAAGPAVIAAVRKAIEKNEVATQAAITKAVQRNSGSVSWALKALEDDGVVEATGERERGSKVYRLRAAVTV